LSTSAGCPQHYPAKTFTQSTEARDYVECQITPLSGSNNIPDSRHDDEEVMDIHTPGVPEVVREHGLGFRKPAHYVVDLGNDEYLLAAQDGETLDIVYLK
jgi:hypothetical protein